jgi:Domain of unknown function (DUF4112)
MDVHHVPLGAKPQRLSARDERRLDRLVKLARLLDARFRIPGSRWKFGVDSLLGLVPGVGDAASAAVSIWIVWQGYRLGASRQTLAAMVANVGVDTLIGAVPLVGDAFDVAYKSNQRNVALLHRDLGGHRDLSGTSRR